MEFQVEPDAESAVKCFISELKLNNYEDILLEKSLEVLKNLKYDNLRNVRQAFFHLKQLINILGPDRNNKYFIADMVEYFLAIFIQKSTGELLEKDCEGAIEAYATRKETYADFINEKNGKDSLHYLFRTIPLNNLYGEIIFRGKFDVQKIIQTYTEWNTPSDKRTPLQKLIQEWFMFNDKDFNKLYKSVDDLFTQNKMLEIYQILQFANLQLELLQHRVFSDTFEIIKDRFLSYIEKNKENLVYTSDFYFDQNTLNTRLSDDSHKIYKIIYDALDKINQSKHIEKVKESFGSLYKELPAAADKLIEFIGLFYNSIDSISIFEDVNINDFVLNIQKCDFDTQRSICAAFQNRYQHMDIHKLKDDSEITCIKTIADIYRPSTKSIVMSTENAQKNILSNWYLNIYNEIASKTSNEGNIET